MKAINVRIMSAAVAVALTGAIATVRPAAADAATVCESKYELYTLVYDIGRGNGVEKCVRSFAAATAFVGSVAERRGEGTFMDTVILAKRIGPSVVTGCREGASKMRPDPRPIFEIRFCGD